MHGGISTGWSAYGIAVFTHIWKVPQTPLSTVSSLVALGLSPALGSLMFLQSIVYDQEAAVLTASSPGLVHWFVFQLKCSFVNIILQGIWTLKASMLPWRTCLQRFGAVWEATLPQPCGHQVNGLSGSSPSIQKHNRKLLVLTCL